MSEELAAFLKLPGVVNTAITEYKMMQEFCA